MVNGLRYSVALPTICARKNEVGMSDYRLVTVKYSNENMFIFEIRRF